MRSETGQDTTATACTDDLYYIYDIYGSDLCCLEEGSMACIVFMYCIYNFDDVSWAFNWIPCSSSTFLAN